MASIFCIRAYLSQRQMSAGWCRESVAGHLNACEATLLAFIDSLRRLIFHRRFEINENLFNHDSETAGIR